MKRKIIAITCFLGILFLCSGCGLRLVSPENLVQAPKSNQEQLQQKQEIMSFLSRDENLIFPESGAQTAIYQTADLDSDGEDEIIAFFNNKENSFQMGFLILDRVNGEYQLRNKEILYGRGIHTFSTLDLDRNGSMEILIGLRTGYGSQKELCLYQVTADGLIDITSDEHLSYDQMSLAKKSDGRNTIVLASMDTSSLISNTDISVYQYENLLLYPVYGAALDGYCNEITYGNISPTEYGIALLLRGNHTVRALMLQEKADSYQLVLDETLPMDYEDLNNQPLFRDINQDGVLEIVSVITPEENAAGKTLQDFLQIWMQWDGNQGSKIVGAVLDNETDGYRLQLPVEWLDEFYYSFRRDAAGDWLDFYALDTSDTYVVAFSLGAIDELTWKQNPISNAVVIGNNPQKNKIYAVIITKEPLKNMEIDTSKLIGCLKIEGGDHS